MSTAARVSNKVVAVAAVGVLLAIVVATLPAGAKDSASYNPTDSTNGHDERRSSHVDALTTPTTPAAPDAPDVFPTWFLADEGVTYSHTVATDTAGWFQVTYTVSYPDTEGLIHTNVDGTDLPDLITPAKPNTYGTTAKTEPFYLEPGDHQFTLTGADFPTQIGALARLQPTDAPDDENPSLPTDDRS